MRRENSRAVNSNFFIVQSFVIKIRLLRVKNVTAHS